MHVILPGDYGSAFKVFYDKDRPGILAAPPLLKEPFYMFTTCMMINIFGKLTKPQVCAYHIQLVAYSDETIRQSTLSCKLASKASNLPNPQITVP